MKKNSKIFKSLCTLFSIPIIMLPAALSSCVSNNSNINNSTSNGGSNNVGNDQTDADEGNEDSSNDNDNAQEPGHGDNSSNTDSGSGSNDSNTDDSNQGGNDSSPTQPDEFPGQDDSQDPSISEGELVSGDPKEGVDFFYLKENDTSDANKITIPKTKNKMVLEKYGNVPLPWKPDSEITKEDLIYMFDYLVSNALYQRDFGQRNIETNLFVNSFIDFLINNYTKYPYISFTNKSWLWNPKEVGGGHNIKELPNKPEYFDNEIYHVKNNYGSNYNSYADSLFRPGLYREEFLQYFTYLFSQIRPGMSDIDKVIATYQFLLTWISYGPGGPTSVFSKHTGYCADYGSIYALMLNVVGIPAFPVITNYNNVQMHECTWLYVDAGNGPKWYVSNPTWGDDNNDVNSSQTKGFLSSKNVFTASYKSRKYFLADVAKTQFEHFIDDGSYISNRFWSLPWTDWASKNPQIGSVGIGNYSFEGTGIMLQEIINEHGTIAPRSKMCWLDGYWYFIYNNNKLVRQKTFDDYNKKEVIDVPENIAKLIFNRDALRTTNMLSYNNKFIFEASSSEAGSSNPNRSLLIFDTHNGEIIWESKQEIKINYYNWDNYTSLNLDIYNKKIEIIRNTGNVLYSQQLTDEDIAKITHTDDKYMTETDVKNTYDLYTIMSNLIKVGEGNNKITKQEKDEYTQKIESIFENSKINKNYGQAVRDIKTAFEELQNKSSKISEEMANIRVLNSRYFVTSENFDKYGFMFGDGLDAVQEPEDLINGNDTTSYNIYFSETGEEPYTLLKENSQSLKITKKDFELIGKSGPQGYYYIEYYPFGKPEHARVSNKTYVELSDNGVPTSAGEIRFNENHYNTNYSKINENWEDSEFYLVTDFTFTQFDKYDIDYTINYINYDTKKESVIYHTQLNKTNPKPQRKIDISSKVNDSNHGVYYAKAVLTEKNNPSQTIDLFTKFIFIMTSDDVMEFTTSIWNELTDLVK